jgi:protein phosphatase
VDGESGYRSYDPAQLERARLIAWLRRLGMPLARIRRLCDLATFLVGVRGSGGDPASAAAVDALKPLETLAVPAEDLLGALADAVSDANRAIEEVGASTPTGGVVSTLTALLWSGSRLALVHIGDTRAYLVRDGELFQITHDHTYVQSLVDEGRLTAEEAASHPQRSPLVRALTGTGGAQPDLSLHEAVTGDRYLLCSDGLSAVVPTGSLREVLTGPGGPQQVLDGAVDRCPRR